jgi:hypothetical protein
VVVVGMIARRDLEEIVDAFDATRKSRPIVSFTVERLHSHPRNEFLVEGHFPVATSS